MPTELVTVNLTRENEKEAWGFELSGGGRDKNVRLFIEQVSHFAYNFRKFACTYCTTAC